MYKKSINFINQLNHHHEEVLLTDPMPANPPVVDPSTPELKEEYPDAPGPILSNNSLQILPTMTGSFLDAKDMNALARTSNTMNKLFKKAMTVKKTVKELLHRAAFGEADKVMAMINKNPNLLLEKGNVTLPSGEHFRDISLFQLLKWGHDPLSKDIWPILLKQSKEKAIQQFEESESKETDYVDKHGRYYDFAPLEQAYTDYDLHFNQGNWDQLDAHWREKIGGKQCRVSVWVAQCFCSGTTWHNNNPQEAQFNAISNHSRSLEFYNFVSGCNEFWFPLLDSGLGKDFAIYSARGDAWAVALGEWARGRVSLGKVVANLAAISHLHVVSLSLQDDLTELFSVARYPALTP